MNIRIRIDKSLAAIFLVTLIFLVLITVFGLKDPGPDYGVGTGYLSALWLFFQSNPVIGIFMAVILGLLAYRKPVNILAVPMAVLGALILVILAVYLNLYLLTLRPGGDLIWKRQEITQKLSDLKKPPDIEVTPMNMIPELMIGRQMAGEGTGTFFGKFITRQIPDTLIPVNIPESNMYLAGNTLIFTAISADDLTAVSPILGYQLVKNYFSPRLIKSNAIFGILNRQDYLKLREKQIGSQLMGIDSYSAKVDKLYSAAAKTVNDYQDGIKAAQAGFENSSKAYELELSVCKAAGYNDIFVHKFIRYHEDAYCLDKAKLDWGDKTDTYRQTIEALNIKLVADQKNLDSINYIRTVTGNYRTTIAAQMSGTPEELGLFHDQNKIDMVLDYSNAKSVPAYLQTLVHEYLHYASFVSDQRILPTAFEEGMTEYYAREVIKGILGKDMTLGYPLIVKIIRQMATKIPADQLQEIYFTKDETLLAKLLNSAYGAGFYEDNSLQFEILPYLPPDKALEIGNMLMSKMGGPILTEKDIFSENMSK